MVATKKKPAPPKYKVSNSEKITNQHPIVQELWEILAKMDPEGELFVNDVGIVSVAGDGPKDRTPEALGFTAEQKKLVTTYGVLDAEEPDDESTARGIICTGYQLLQAAFDKGREFEASQVTSAITSAAAPGADDEDEEEDFDDEEEDSLDEEDEDEADDDDDVEDDDDVDDDDEE